MTRDRTQLVIPVGYPAPELVSAPQVTLHPDPPITKENYANEQNKTILKFRYRRAPFHVLLAFLYQDFIAWRRDDTRNVLLVWLGYCI